MSFFECFHNLEDLILIDIDLHLILRYFLILSPLSNSWMSIISWYKSSTSLYNIRTMCIFSDNTSSSITDCLQYCLCIFFWNCKDEFIFLHRELFCHRSQNARYCFNFSFCFFFTSIQFPLFESSWFIPLECVISNAKRRNLHINCTTLQISLSNRGSVILQVRFSFLDGSFLFVFLGWLLTLDLRLTRNIQAYYSYIELRNYWDRFFVYVRESFFRDYLSLQYRILYETDS